MKRGRNIVSKIISRFLLGVAVLLGSYYFLYPHVFRCQTIRFSSFQSVGSSIYVSPAIAPLEYNKIKLLVELSTYRNTLFWGNVKASPTIIICATAEEYERFCQSSEGAGCSISTPLSDSYIVINQQALNIDVMSHEMCHNEIYTRLGWWKATFQVPQWFHEGVALMVDYRFVATNDPVGRVKGYARQVKKLRRRGYKPIPLEEISTLRGFFQGSQMVVNNAYMTSGREVAHWLAIVGQESLPLFMDELKSGKEFLEVYAAFKQKSRLQNN